MSKISEHINGSNQNKRLFGNGEYTDEQELYCRVGANIIASEINTTIEMLIQEIKQEPGVSNNQSTYAVRVLERLRQSL